MRKIWTIAGRHLSATYRSRAALIFGFAMPIVFTIVIGSAMGSGGRNTAEPETYHLAVINSDGGALGEQLAGNLEAHPLLEVVDLDAVTARVQLEDEEISAILTLPEDFSERLLAGGALELEYVTNIGNAISGQVVEQAVQATLNEISSALDISAASLRVAARLGLFEIEGAPNEAAYQSEALSLAETELQAGPPIGVETTQETQRELETPIPFGFQQSSPGNAVIFAMFFVMAGAGSLVVERERGTLPRLMTTPVSKAAIMAGKLLGVYIAAILQFTIMVLLGQFLFGVDWGAEALGMALMVAAFTFCITGLGMLVASLVRTHGQIDAVSTLLIMPLAGLGGAMWPLEIVPAWMQQLAGFLPTGLAMQGFHDLIVRGLGTTDILFEAGALTAFGLVFLAIGVWRFRYE